MTSIIERLSPKITPEIENTHRKAFERQSRYLGNGLYGIPECNLYSNDTLELALMFYAQQELINGNEDFKESDFKDIDEDDDWGDDDYNSHYDFEK